jgi:hypothetical protein
MKYDKVILTVKELRDARANFNFTPPYQRRSGVWTMPKRKRLILSVIRGIDIPKFYIHENEGRWDFVDGNQRTNTILDFLDDEFVTNTPDMPEVHRRKFSKLRAEDQARFLGHELDFVFCRDCTIADVREMFLLHQSGLPLNSAEKRNAIPGWLHDEMDRVTLHKFFTLLSTPNTRFQHQTLALRTFALELFEQPRTVGVAAAARLLKEYGSPSERATDALARQGKILDLMFTAFQHKAGVNLLIENSVALYWTFRELGNVPLLLTQYFGDYFLDFEERRRVARRRKNEGDKELISVVAEMTGRLSVRSQLDYIGDFFRKDFETYLMRRGVRVSGDGALHPVAPDELHRKLIESATAPVE